VGLRAVTWVVCVCVCTCAVCVRVRFRTCGPIAERDGGCVSVGCDVSDRLVAAVAVAVVLEFVLTQLVICARKADHTRHTSIPLHLCLPHTLRMRMVHCRTRVASVSAWWVQLVVSCDPIPFDATLQALALGPHGCVDRHRPTAQLWRHCHRSLLVHRCTSNVAAAPRTTAPRYRTITSRVEVHASHDHAFLPWHCIADAPLPLSTSMCAFVIAARR
jgi:hypothetical protein